jgi:hypothetical protein
LRRPSLRTGRAALPHPALQSAGYRISRTHCAKLDASGLPPTSQADALYAQTRFPLQTGPWGLPRSSLSGQSMRDGVVLRIPLFSAFLPPLAPPALPGFNATMAALTSAECCAPSGLTTPCPGSSPAFTALPFPDLLPPTTPQTSRLALVSGEV